MRTHTANELFWAKTVMHFKNDNTTTFSGPVLFRNSNINLWNTELHINENYTRHKDWSVDYLWQTININVWLCWKF